MNHQGIREDYSVSDHSISRNEQIEGNARGAFRPFCLSDGAIDERRSHEQRIHCISESGKLKHSWQVKKELSFARAKLNRPGLTLANWNELIKQGDHYYIGVLNEYNTKLASEKTRSVLNRYIKEKEREGIGRIQDDITHTIEENQRRARISAKRFDNPMSNKARTRLIEYIGRLRHDVECYKISGRLVKNFCDRRTGPYKSIRKDFHKWPLDPQVQAKGKELNDWMKKNQLEYLPIEYPTEYYSNGKGKASAQSSRENNEGKGYTPKLLDKAEYEAIREHYSSEEAFMESLFGPDGEKEYSIDQEEEELPEQSSSYSLGDLGQMSIEDGNEWQRD